MELEAEQKPAAAPRITAAVVVLAGVALLAWVGLRGDATSEVASSATSTAEAATGAADEPGEATATGNDEPGEATAPTPEANTAESESETENQVPTATAVPAFPEPENFGPRRQLENLDGWLNTETISSLDDLDGKVVLVEMWTFGCYNCKARIPYNQSYYEQFDRDDFEMVGVHAPEFSYEAEVANIEQALIDLGVTWPIALDTSKKNFRSWQEGTTSYWPRTYVIDQNGDIRYDHIGEGKYEKLRSTIDYLIENPPAPSPAP